MKSLIQKFCSIVTVFLFIFSVNSIMYGQSNNSSPSLDETLKFIQEKITDYGTTYNDLPSDTKFKNVSEIKFIDGCQVVNTYKGYPPDMGGTYPFDYQDNFYFGDIDPSNISLSDFDEGNWAVVLFTINKELKIKRSATFYTDLNRKNVRSSFNKDLNVVEIPVKGKDIAERLSRAFKNAAMLCSQVKKKAEPF